MEENNGVPVTTDNASNDVPVSNAAVDSQPQPSASEVNFGGKSIGYTNKKN